MRLSEFLKGRAASEVAAGGSSSSSAVATGLGTTATAGGSIPCSCALRYRLRGVADVDCAEHGLEAFFRGELLAAERELRI